MREIVARSIGIVGCLLMLGGGLSAFAYEDKRTPIANEDILSLSDDFEEVKEIEDEIVSWLRICIANPIKLSEIDYKNSVRIYYNADILESGMVEQDEILDRLHSSSYAWDIRYTDEYEVTVDRRVQPGDKTIENLTPQEQIIYENKYGRLEVSSMGEGKFKNYIEELYKWCPEAGDYDRIVFMRGERGFYDVLAVAFKDGKAEKTIFCGAASFMQSGARRVMDFEDAAAYAGAIVVEEGMCG